MEREVHPLDVHVVLALSFSIRTVLR